MTRRPSLPHLLARVMLLAWTAILIFHLAANPVSAEELSPEEERAAKLSDPEMADKNVDRDEPAPTDRSQTNSPAADPALPVPPPGFVDDPETYEKYLRALGEYFDYRASGLQHRRNVFDWQLLSAKIIFVIVLTLVAAGVYFAAVQFHVEIRNRNPGEAAQQSTTNISAGPNGITVSSGVLGVIILTLSLAFFYLYLVHVYPIEDIF